MKKHDLTKTHLHRASPGMALYAAFAGVTMAAMLCQPVFAATVWEKANEIMKDVYNQILLISTIAAIVTASVALWTRVALGSSVSSSHGQSLTVWASSCPM